MIMCQNQVVNAVRYDAETGFYYVSSRYYDPEIGRFISADVINVVLASQTTLTDKNLYAYCDNNPVMRVDEEGYFWAEIGIFATGGIIGAMMGAFSAAATGGDVMQGAVKGGMLGVYGSICGLAKINPLTSGMIAGLIDLGMQAADMYNTKGNIDLLELNYVDAIITGVETTIGVAVNPVGTPRKNVVDAIGTAVVWSEVTVVTTCADVVLRNTYSAAQTKQVGKINQKSSKGSITKSRISSGMTTADYFRRAYNMQEED